MRIAFIISMVFALFFSPKLVRAEPGTCVSGSPGSPACAEQSPPDPIAAGWQPVQPAPAQPVPRADDLSRVTHSFYLPTGNLTPAGEFAVNVHELGLFNTVAYGVSDHVELSAGAPALPFVWNVAARVSLTAPETPLRAVLGGSIWMPLVQDSGDDFTYFAQGTITLGYQSGAWNIHGTLSAVQASFDDEVLVAGSAGLLYRTGPSWAIMGDISTLGVAERTSCGSDCWSEAPVQLLNVGMKYMGSKWDVDFGVVIPFVDDEEDLDFVLMPLVSFHRH